MPVVSTIHRIVRSERGTTTSARVAIAQQLERASHALREAPEYQCSVCNTWGRFLSEGYGPFTRHSAVCPNCGARERHRLQSLALKTLAKNGELKDPQVLHAAPEPLISEQLKSLGSSYLSIDLDSTRAERVEDLTLLSFASNSFDLVFASHVLEHISKDRQALAEIYRVLRPGGIAILPVPIVAGATVEYGKAILAESGHVRAPGLDYFDRYRETFDHVSFLRSTDFDASYQLLDLTDRNKWGEGLAQHRPSMEVRQSVDFVPICRKEANHA